MRYQTITREETRWFFLGTLQHQLPSWSGLTKQWHLLGMVAGKLLKQGQSFL
jgi:hypothetical protein